MALVRIKEKQVLAVALDEGRYMDEEGEVVRLDKSNVKIARNVPDEVRKSFDNMAAIWKKREKTVKKFAELQHEYNKTINDLQEQHRCAVNNLRSVRGFLSKSDFCDVFYDSLLRSVRLDMASKGYDIDTPVGVLYNDDEYLYISKSHIVQKYFRHASFLEEEYDGCIFMVDGAENYQEYQEILKRHSSPLNVKFEFNEHLFMGDKDSLCYSAYYKIPIKKNLTKEYAKELAAEFCK